MEEPPKKGTASQETEKKLAAFREEIAKMQQEEIAGVRKTADFVPSPEIGLPKFDVHELTAEDVEIYEKAKSGTITAEEWGEYHGRTMEILESARDKKSISTRKMFDAYIANLVHVIFMRRELDKGKKKQG